MGKYGWRCNNVGFQLHAAMAIPNEIMVIHKSIMDTNEGLFAFGFPFSLFADVDKGYYPHAAPRYHARSWAKRGIAVHKFL